MNNILTTETSLNIRFSDTDAMGIVWHGNYLHYFEDGREAFGKEYGLSTLYMFKQGFFTPFVKSEMDFKSPVYFGSEVKIITSFVPQKSAKLVFEYEIINSKDNSICTTGKTIQVFLDSKTRTLELNTPKFFEEWKIKHQLNPL